MLSKDAKIMVVDDMKLIRTAIRRYLSALGYDNVVEADDGRDALDKFAGERPEFIFLDIVMPTLTGDKVLQEIRKTDSRVPIVMLTSVAEEGTIKECEEQGITGYAIKPINKENGPQLIADFLGHA